MATKSTPTVQSEDITTEDSKESTTVLKYLNKCFLHQNFINDVQKNAITKIVERKSDTFLSIPKASGRSLCYQLPAVIHLPKMTVVVCPCIVRIRKHIDRLTSLKIQADTINSYMPLGKQKAAIRNYFGDDISTCLLYVTPDVATTNPFTKLLDHLVQKNKLAYIVVDESYYEVQWTYGQKLQYQNLGKFREDHLEIPWIVATATAGSDIVSFVQRTLHLKVDDAGYAKFSPSHFRSNIYYDVVLSNIHGSSYHNLKGFIDECLMLDEIKPSPLNSSCGLIYCKNKEKCKEIAVELGQRGVLIASYHADFNDYDQLTVHKAFMAGDYKVLAVTSIAGMSIDKKNVRFVVHWGMPLNMLIYYLETSVAGGDGKLAQCRIYATTESTEYFSLARELQLKSTINECLKNNPQKLQNASRAYLMFLHSRNMIEYCKTFICRHQYICKHFGEETPTCEDKCDICTRVTEGFFDENSAITKDSHQFVPSYIKNIYYKYKDLVDDDMVTDTDKLKMIKLCDKIIKNNKMMNPGSKLMVYENWYELVKAFSYGDSPLSLDATNENIKTNEENKNWKS